MRLVHFVRPIFFTWLVHCNYAKCIQYWAIPVYLERQQFHIPCVTILVNLNNLLLNIQHSFQSYIARGSCEFDTIF